MAKIAVATIGTGAYVPPRAVRVGGILGVLEAHGSRCMDSAEDREALAHALALHIRYTLQGEG